MRNAIIGLAANLTAWRAGTRDAATIVRQSLNERTLDGFNRGVDHAFKNANAKGRDLFGGIRNGIGSIKGAWVAVAGIVSGIAFGRIGRELSTAVAKSREFGDMLERIRVSAEASGNSFDAGRASAFARGLGLGTGRRQSELAGVLALFTQKFDQQTAQYLTTLTNDLAAKLNVPLERAAKLVQYAQAGNLEAFKEFNLPVPKDTGTKSGNAQSAIEVLQRFAPQGTAATLSNAGKHLAARWESLQIDLGTKLVPTVDKILNGIEAFLAGIDPEQLATNVQDIAGAVAWVGKGVDRLWGNLPLKRLIDLFKSDEWKSQMGRIENTIDHAGILVGRPAPSTPYTPIGELVDGSFALQRRLLGVVTDPPSSGLGDYVRDTMSKGREQMELARAAQKAGPQSPPPAPSALVDPYARQFDATAAEERRRKESERREQEAQQAREDLARNARLYSNAPAGAGFSVNVVARNDPRLAKQRAARFGRRR